MARRAYSAHAPGRVSTTFFMDATGISRDRVYTREEICSRFGYGPDDSANLNRFFKKHFLSRGLRATPVGKTYEVPGEVYYAWALLNARFAADDEVQTG